MAKLSTQLTHRALHVDQDGIAVIEIYRLKYSQRCTKRTALQRICLLTAVSGTGPPQETLLKSKVCLSPDMRVLGLGVSRAYRFKNGLQLVRLYISKLLVPPQTKPQIQVF